MTGWEGGQSRQKLLILCTVVSLVAILLRLNFVTQVFAGWQTLPPDVALDGEHGFFTRDSFSYLSPANALLSGDILHGGSLRRPPGYPLFLALCGASFLPILVVQALVGGLIPACTVLLTYLLTRRLALAALAAILAVVSPTGLGMTGLVMADLLLAALVAAGLLLMVAAAKRRQQSFLLAAGATFGAASLVKPVLLLWAPVSLLMVWLFAGRTIRFMRRRTLALFVALQLLPVLGWSARNYAVEGVFTFSSIGLLGMREYLATRTEAWVDAGRSPSESAIRKRQAEVRERFRAYRTGNAEKLRRYRAETREIARAHTGIMLKVYLTNVSESVGGGWNYFPRQLPLGHAVSVPYVRAAEIEGRVRSLVPLILGLAILAAALARQVTKTASSRQHFLDVVALCLVWGYFVTVGGITFWTGPRLFFPAHSAVVAASLLGVCALLDLLQFHSRQMRPATDQLIS